MDKKKPILVIGSSNMDLVVKTNRFPKPGETLIGGKFFMNNGGKGANQAIAVSRLGGEVNFVCKTGRDSFREQTIELFRKEGINTEWMFIDNEEPSGVALIMIDEKAENSIIVAPGANGNLSIFDINSIEEMIDYSEFILLQLEIPLKTVHYIVNMAYEKGKKVVFNPAPADSLSEDLFEKLYLITPNEIEAEFLTGVNISDDDSIIMAAKVLYEKGVKNAVITLGKKGALLYNGTVEWIPAIPSQAVDTTGAGDVFNGALTVALSEGQSLSDAVRFANKAASISITRYGAIPSIPHREEVLEPAKTN